jgi:hypothetical protein
MSLSTSLYAIADALDPRMAYWSVETTRGKVWSERQLIPTWHEGVKGVRKLDWLWDIVGTGDIKRLKTVTLHCPDGRTGVLEMTEPGEMRSKWPAFQFRNKSVDVISGYGRLEFLVVGRVIDPANGWCECFIWDYYPRPEQLYAPEIPAEGEHTMIPEQLYRPADPSFLAYRSNINAFGSWKDSMTPIGSLNMEVQGFRI